MVNPSKMQQHKIFALAAALLMATACSEVRSATVINAPGRTSSSVAPFWEEDSLLEDKSYRSSEEADMRNWRAHPCRRDCREGEPPMECRYVFHLEHYYAMSKACYNCPHNLTDCFLPHCIQADGVRRPLVVVNRQMPGPAIEVCEGDRVIVDATNMMRADSTTLHWHGQHMAASPYMDGTPYVSQCPIPPGASFRYDFIAETPGTHFWHSHVGFQRGDGMFGPLIIRRSQVRDQLRNLYDYDEHTILVSDWDHELGIDKFLAHYHSNGDNKPVNLLINGRGRFLRKTLREGNPQLTPTAVFTVTRNTRHRFRLINAEFLNCPMEMSIDNHTLWVVSSDGKDIEPVEAKSLVTYAGERFDVIVEMNQNVSNYWIRFRGLLDCGPGFTKAHQVAILRYDGAPDEDPAAEVGYEFPPKEEMSPQVNALNKGTETKSILSVPMLEALDKNDEANTREPDHQYYISYDFYSKNNFEFHRKNLYEFHQVTQKVGTPQLNHISMRMPSFPLMSQTELIDTLEFCNSSTVSPSCKSEYCACPHVLQVELDSVIELVLVDEGVPYDANHPFHLHGHAFRVVAMERLGSNVTVEEVKRIDREGKIRRKLERAPIKDTVTIPDGGYTVIRFHANNPGYWLFHCHIEFHSEVGMALVFKVGEHADFAPVPPKFPRCGDFSPPLRTPRPTTTSSTSSRHPNDLDNEVDHVDEKVRSSIANWLPLILSELRAANVSSSASWGIHGGVALLSWLVCLCAVYWAFRWMDLGWCVFM